VIHIYFFILQILRSAVRFTLERVVPYMIFRKSLHLVLLLAYSALRCDFCTI